MLTGVLLKTKVSRQADKNKLRQECHRQTQHLFSLRVAFQGAPFTPPTSFRDCAVGNIISGSCTFPCRPLPSAKTYETVKQTTTLPIWGIPNVPKIFEFGTPKVPQITLLDVWSPPGDIKGVKVSKVIPKGSPRAPQRHPIR